MVVSEPKGCALLLLVFVGVPVALIILPIPKPPDTVIPYVGFELLAGLYVVLLALIVWKKKPWRR